MNPGKLKRAIDRHRFMKDLPAYSAFLDYVETQNSVWKATQHEVAVWWESRQKAQIELEIVAPGRLSVSCPLDGAAVEIDGAELGIPPFEIPISADIPPGPVRINCSGEADNDTLTFLNELLGHFGYRHVVPGANATLPLDSIRNVLERLRTNAIEHWNYREDDIREFRAAVGAAHRRKGIPELRLWSLPCTGGEIWRVCVSPRYDVDKAIVNMPMIHALEDSHGAGSTVYLRPAGLFYGEREIRAYVKLSGRHEVALHGEFVTTAEKYGIDEFEAARKEKALLERHTGEEIHGVCMHGGELRANASAITWKAIESAGFSYETHYRNQYYLPLHLPSESGIRRTLSIGQHFADISVAPDGNFAENLTAKLMEHYQKARDVGGVFVPVMHPLYFSIGGYLRHPTNVWRLAAFIPRYVATLSSMKRGQQYANRR